MPSQHFPNATRLSGSDNVIHNVWQTAELGNVTTSSSGGEVGGARAFSISDIQGIASWLAVFDQYKIIEIEAWMTPSGTTQVLVDNFRWLNVVDYDDASVFSFNQLLQYSNVADCGRNEGCYRRWRPHISVNVQSSNALNRPSDWIDSANQSIPHYALKWVLSSTGTSVVLGLRVRYHIQFRNAF